MMFIRVLSEDVQARVAQGWSVCADVECDSPSLAAQGMRAVLMERAEDGTDEVDRG